MTQRAKTDAPPSSEPGAVIRSIRKRNGLTLSALGERTGLAVSTLSKLEKGDASLSYDKLMILSKGLDVDVAELLNPSSTGVGDASGRGRRTIQRSTEGQLIVTKSYAQLYLATELLTKRFTPILVEVKARSIEEFMAEFGDFIRHPGEEFAFVLEGELEFRSELYAPARLKAGDSLYFDSEMGHAYLNVSDEPCRMVNVCSPRGSSDSMIATFVSASQRSGNGGQTRGAEQGDSPKKRRAVARAK